MAMQVLENPTTDYTRFVTPASSPGKDGRGPKIESRNQACNKNATMDITLRASTLSYFDLLVWNV